MATLQPVTAGFIIVPSRERERHYLEFISEHGENSVPIDEALFELRETDEGGQVVLLPLRSYEAARRICNLFETGSKAHQKAQLARAKMGSS